MYSRLKLFNRVSLNSSTPLALFFSSCLVSLPASAHEGPTQGGQESPIHVISQNPLDTPLRECRKAGNKNGSFIRGKSMRLGEGKIRSFVQMGDNDEPVSIGMEIDEKALTALPQDHLYLEYELDLPCNVAPFSHIGFDWNRQGHPPEQLFGVPHFDAHFYIITKAQRHAITCMGEDAERCAKAPESPRLIPENYVSTSLAVPRMGMHWANPQAPEMPMGKFSVLPVYGFYDGKLAFIEPMFTLELLRSRPNLTNPLSQPEVVEVPGYYPASYSVRYDEKRKTYRVSLDGLRRRP